VSSISKYRESSIKITAGYIAEPLLLFGDNGRCVDPRLGLATFGPQSRNDARHPDRVRLGFVGSAETICQAKGWVRQSAIGLAESEGERPFPGCMADRGFFTQIAVSDTWDELITRSELTHMKKSPPGRSRFEIALALLTEKMLLISEKDQPPDLVVLALPSQIVTCARVADYWDPQLGQVHRDLRRALKAKTMNLSIPTQILLPRTTRGGRGVDLPERRAWNFFTALYFKAGGVPWKPVGLTANTCFIGISFYRPLGTKSHRLRTSIAIAFDESGEGLILRGQEFPWSEDDGPSPHLSADQARELLSMTLERYRAERKHSPKRVVVHKSSVYWPDEREGFEEVLTKEVAEFDLLAFAPLSNTRLIRQGLYPPLRGTWFTLGDLDFLYTTGYIPELKTYSHGHVPSPLRIMDHVGGDTSRETLLREVLILSKLNWNSANLGGLMPITLRFSRLVGDILRETTEKPKPQFKFYI